jgi:hypothetical protein
MATRMPCQTRSRRRRYGTLKVRAGDGCRRIVCCNLLCDHGAVDLVLVLVMMLVSCARALASLQPAAAAAAVLRPSLLPRCPRLSRLCVERLFVVRALGCYGFVRAVSFLCTYSRLEACIVCEAGRQVQARRIEVSL